MSPEPGAELLAAYDAARYDVLGESPAVLRASDVAGSHDDWLVKNECESAVIITAWNPFGQPISQKKNDAANRHLLKAIENRSLRWTPARGGLLVEESFCVFDTSDSQIEHWLVTYQQNAALRIRMRGRPELIWHMRFGAP